MQPAVVFDGVWKKFHRGERQDSLRDLVPAAFGRLTRRRRDTDALAQQEFWAVQDVSFDVRPGEAFGIIGPNGAGKSTTLKLLTKILKPTRGTASVRGRVGALIEVAAGFHPDLTGRENVYLQGAIMGMKRADIARCFDEIVDFAGVGSFIDTPVKRYSSGMHARLGFSIAAHLEPDVLLIDEVLSVGDMAFQERCMSRMERFKAEGVTIVFVSHNLQAVATLCDQALYLNRGVRAVGPSRDVLATYIQESARVRPQDYGDIAICSTELLRRNGDPTDVVEPGAEMILRVTYGARAALDNLTLGFILYRSNDRLLVYDGNVRMGDLGARAVRAGDRFVVDFAFRANLTRGHYYLECHVFHNPTHTFLARLSPAGTITVAETLSQAGVADLDLRPRLVTEEAVVLR